VTNTTEKHIERKNHNRAIEKHIERKRDIQRKKGYLCICIDEDQEKRESKMGRRDQGVPSCFLSVINTSCFVDRIDNGSMVFTTLCFRGYASSKTTTGFSSVPTFCSWQEVHIHY